MKKSQIVESVNGKVLKCYGVWTVEATKRGLCVSDNFCTYWMLCYDSKSFCIDNPERLPSGLITWIRDNVSKLYYIQENNFEY